MHKRVIILVSENNPTLLKRLSIILVSLLTLFPLGSFAASDHVLPIEIHQEEGPILRIPEITPPVSCEYSSSTETLTIIFSENVGAADIEIQHQFLGVVASSDSEATPGVLYLPVNDVPGIYTITIQTSLD